MPNPTRPCSVEAMEADCGQVSTQNACKGRSASQRTWIPAPPRHQSKGKWGHPKSHPEESGPFQGPRDTLKHIEEKGTVATPSLAQLMQAWLQDTLREQVPKPVCSEMHAGVHVYACTCLIPKSHIRGICSTLQGSRLQQTVSPQASGLPLCMPPS